MSRTPDDALALLWRDLVERRLPHAAAARADWPVSRDHCFARILLDNACGGPWRDRIRPPAWANASDRTLRAALAFGEAVLAGEAKLALLNHRSIAWRGKSQLHALDQRPATADRGAYRQAGAPRDLFDQEIR